MIYVLKFLIFYNKVSSIYCQLQKAVNEISIYAEQRLPYSFFIGKLVYTSDSI